MRDLTTACILCLVTLQCGAPAGSDGSPLEQGPAVTTKSRPPPTLTVMTPPVSGATMSGTIVVRARASVAAGTTLASVTVEQQGCSSQTSTTAPFRFEWDTSCDGSDGLKTLRVTALAADGAKAMTTVTLTAQNERTVSGKTFPRGIVFDPSFGGPALTASFFEANPWIAGVSDVFQWSDVQPDYNTAITDFSAFDALMSLSENVKRTTGHPKVIFIVKPGGTGIPPWLTGAPLYRPYFTASQMPNIANESSLVPWDPVVSDYFVNLASQLAARYDNDPDFAGIYVAGVNAQYPEMIFSSSPAWANAAAPPPNGIATTVDDVDPPLTPDAAGAALYANAWLRNARLMATQFRQSRIVNMLDAMIALPSAVQYDALDSIYQTINGTYSAHATMGTANLGDPDVISLSAHKYVVLDSSYPGNETPVFYEIGPRKVDTTNTHSLADAVRACAQGTATGELGCTAVTIFNSSWYGANQDVGDVGTASCEVWGGTACP